MPEMPGIKASIRLEDFPYVILSTLLWYKRLIHKSHIPFYQITLKSKAFLPPPQQPNLNYRPRTKMTPKIPNSNISFFCGLCSPSDCSDIPVSAVFQFSVSNI